MKSLRSHKASSYFYLPVIALLLATMNAMVPMSAATAQVIPSLELQTVSTSLNLPLYLTAPPGDNNRLFIVERFGQIRIIKNGVLLGTPFLNVNSIISGGDDQQGLLGLAFDPNYAINGRFYIYYTDRDGYSRIARYLVSANPDIAQTSPDKILLTNDPPFEGHYGGDMIFGPDGYLYISIGDGGCCNDPLGNGQDLSDLMGSLLRIDVRPQGDYVIPTDNPFVGTPNAKPEIWNYGLRNPWRFSFDRLTGDLYIGDVGQDNREEINVSTALQGRGKGLNYGWRIMEGFRCNYPTSNCNQTGLTLPVLDYDRSSGCSVTGGYVYRGSAIPAIQGTYFYADFCLGWVRSFKYQNGQATNQMDWASLRPGGLITSFGEDARGELYIMTLQGGVYRIITTTPSTTTTSTTTTIRPITTTTSTTTTTRPTTTTTTTRSATTTTTTSTTTRPTTSTTTTTRPTTTTTTTRSATTTTTTSTTTRPTTTTTTILSSPSISSFTPNKGHAGKSVIITGKGFTSATDVQFKGTSATTFTLLNSTRIQAIVPTGTCPGTGPISVSTPSGTVVSEKSFTCAATVKGFTPNKGPAETNVIIKGTGFMGTTAVQFNQIPATIFTVLSSTRIQATVPTGACPGTGPISVSTPSGTVISEKSFTCAALVKGFTPNKGPAETSVIIKGTGFMGTTAVQFNQIPATIFTVLSSTRIQATVPTGAITGPISVITPSGTAASAKNFTVQ